MATELHTFMDIFDSQYVDDNGEPSTLERIIIPMIQRDYAQGRKGTEIARVRERFLNSLLKAVTEKPITLDFVYGDLQDGIMTPLDGQQRLTTLFLLHWYAAKKDHIPEIEYSFLQRFSYQTRSSAKHFCIQLIKHQPSFANKLSDEIIDQTWFPLDWKKDPTISSMLVMIDAIDETFKKTPDLWARLKSGAISFYFLPIMDMGLTDELYIKMNSRGKPLTTFEHFKAELEGELRSLDESLSKRIIRKIDRDWTELLWIYRDEDNLIDDAFLRYFKFVCDVICYRDGGTPQGRSNDEFDLIEMYFSSKCSEAKENAITLEKFFDCWYQDLKNEKPNELASKFISYNHETGKIKIEKRYEIDIFADCLHTYADSTGRRRTFPLNRIVLLYALTIFLQNRAIVTDDQFSRRLRIINNLIQNSEDEISDSEARASGNRMPAILSQVDSIVLHGIIDSSIDKNFSVNQLTEEAEKQKWLTMNPELTESLFCLEDHQLLQGQISIVGLENARLFSKFEELFNCNWDKVDRALMSIGFYGQREQNNWRFQFGSGSTRNIDAWRSIFHKSRNTGFDQTHSILVQLIDQDSEITDDYLDSVAVDYIDQCESQNRLEWRYYFVKYSTFRPSSFGKFSNSEFDSSPYLFSVMLTQSKWSENTYNPFLKTADEVHLSRDDYGQKLVYKDGYIKCLNNSFALYSKEDDSLIEEWEISHDDDGIDTENRIKKLKKIIQDIISTGNN